MREYQSDIDELWNFLETEGVVFPSDLASTMVINDRLNSYLRDLYERGYDQGRYDYEDSYDYNRCYNECCY